VTAPELAGRVCLVTGASRGIGRAIAIALARAGCDVAINCRSRIEDAQRVAADVAASGRRALVSQADVSRAPAVAAMITEINHALGPIDILINNAGIALRRGIDDLTEADFD
jgi:3-oxoacyl-[acyl-carrier protein] reductase